MPVTFVAGIFYLSLFNVILRLKNIAMNKKEHWEKVYETKHPNEVSWTQEVPHTSIKLIENSNLSKDASIIDIGGGDSHLVDYLLKEGYTNISVLDISSKAIERAKKRLEKKANLVTWITSDILDFVPKKKYDCWHDRAAFHFLTNENDIEYYKDLVAISVKNTLIVGTFSDHGPKKCSGLDVSQYNPESLSKIFGNCFSLIESKIEDHETPFNTLQNFVFCRMQKN